MPAGSVETLLNISGLPDRESGVTLLELDEVGPVAIPFVAITVKV
jgi:hypothetical protein